MSPAVQTSQRSPSQAWAAQYNMKGGIYKDADGNLTVERWPAGNRSGINATPQMPPRGLTSGWRHTHPNWHPPDGKDEAGMEWDKGPSDTDKNAKTPGTTGIIRDRSGNVTFY